MATRLIDRGAGGDRVAAVGDALGDELPAGRQAAGVRQRGQRGGRRSTSPASSSAAAPLDRRRCRRSRWPTARRGHGDRPTTTASARCSPARCRRSARPGDVALGLSTSGGSANVLRGLGEARAAGCRDRRPARRVRRGLRPAVDHCLAVPSSNTPADPGEHLLWRSPVCELVERSPAATRDAALVLPRPRRDHQRSPPRRTRYVADPRPPGCCRVRPRPSAASTRRACRSWW